MAISKPEYEALNTYLFEIKTGTNHPGSSRVLYGIEGLILHRSKEGPAAQTEVYTAISTHFVISSQYSETQIFEFDIGSRTKSVRVDISQEGSTCCGCWFVL